MLVFVSRGLFGFTLWADAAVLGASSWRPVVLVGGFAALVAALVVRRDMIGLWGRALSIGQVVLPHVLNWFSIDVG